MGFINTKTTKGHMSEKIANTSFPILSLLTQRWSPYAFSEKKVAPSDLLSLFEAARWAPSSYNEQPWSYIVATSDNKEEFQLLLSCLVEANQEWAKYAPVLALGVASMKFARNGKDNRAAMHDLGAASANLSVEAIARNIYVHQMVGILPDRAKEVYKIPDGYEALTGLAIGYLAENSNAAAQLQERDRTKRQRKTLSEFVFGKSWGQSSDLVK